MTDPFSDLERELLAAHGRDLARGPRRHLGGAGRAIATLAAVAAIVVSISVIAGIASGGGDPERAASSGGSDPAAPAGSCGGGFIPPVSTAPIPVEVAGALAIFRRKPIPTDTVPLDPYLFGGQAVRVYARSQRRLTPTTEYDIYTAAAEIVPRASVRRGDDPCAAPAGATEPGVCLALTNPKGAIATCFTVAEIEQGKAFIDTDVELIGLAPDTARVALFKGATSECDVKDNLFRILIPEGFDLRGARGEFRS